MLKIPLIIAALSGALAVGLGAFGAHALKEHVSPERLDTYQTASLYHFIHTLVLLFCALRPEFKWSFYLFGIGLLLFSGSLYALVLTDTPKLGIITPFGGLILIAGWLALAYAAYQKF